MTIDELEILIQVKVEEARKNIQSFIKEVKKATSELNNTMSKDVDFSKLKVELVPQVKQEVSKVTKTVQQSMDTIKKEIKKPAKDIQTLTKEMDNFTSATSKTAKQQAYLKAQIEDLKASLADQQDLAGKAESGLKLDDVKNLLAGGNLEIDIDTAKTEAKIEQLENQLARLQEQDMKSDAFKKIDSSIEEAKKKLQELAKTDITFDVSKMNLDEVKAKLEELTSVSDEFSKDFREGLSGKWSDELKKYSGDLAIKIYELNDALKEIPSTKASLEGYSKDLQDIKASMTKLTDSGLVDVSAIDTLKDKVKEVESLLEEMTNKFGEGHILSDDEVDRWNLLIAKMNEVSNQEYAIRKALQSSNAGGSGGTSQTTQNTVALNVDGGKAIDEIKTIKEAWLNVLYTIEGEFPKLGQLRVNIKDWLDSDPLLNKIAEIKENIQNKLSEVKANVSEWIDSSALINKSKEIASNVGDKLSDVGGKLGRIGNSLAIPFQMMKEKASESIENVKSKVDKIKNVFEKPINGVKKFINWLGKIKSKVKESSSSASSMGKNFTSAFESGIKSIKRFAMSLLSVRTGFSLISKAAQSYLSFDSELSDSITNCWNTLGSLLAPILETVVSLFSKATSYVAAFVKALTGIDLVAKANAKALNSQAEATESASSASKSLSSIDDISTLSSGSSSSSGDSDVTTITTVDVDTSAFDKIFEIIEKIKEKILTLFEPIQASWNTYGAGLISSISSSFDSLIGLADSLYQAFENVWTNGTGQTVMDNLLQNLTMIFDIVSGIADGFTNAWNEAGLGESIIQGIFDFINANMEIVNGIGTAFQTWILSESFTSAITSVLQIISAIEQFINSIAKSVLKWVISDSFQEAVSNVLDFIKDILGYVQDIANWVVEMYDQYVKPVVDEILLLITDVINLISTIWTNIVKPVLDPIIEVLKVTLEPIIETVFATLEVGFYSIRTAINVVKELIEKFATFFKQIFTGDFKGALQTLKSIFETVWNGIWDIIKKIANWIISGVENLVNAIIKGLNLIIKPLANIGNTILSVLGIKGFSFSEISEVSLPRLKSGNVAYEETLAVFGEYANASTNPEITAPQSVLKETMRDVMSEYSTNDNDVQRIIVNLGAENLVDVIVDEINRRTQRKGVSVIKGV